MDQGLMGVDVRPRGSTPREFRKQKLIGKPRSGLHQKAWQKLSLPVLPL